MSITGSAAAKKILRGKLSATEMIYIDAYELACIHGFKGTIEEWLEAVMGHSGVPDRDGYSPTLEVTPITGGIRVTVTNKDGTDVKDIKLSASDLGAVPTSRTVNGKALSGNVSLSASDLGAVPTYRTVNGKALSGNITLSASDVGARPSSWTPSATAVGAVSGNPGAMFDDHVLTVVNGKATWVQPAVGFYSAFSLDKDSTYTDCFYRQVFNADVGKVEKEWLNPPMLIGTEYRTTERYRGKPVYTKLFAEVFGSGKEVSFAVSDTYAKIIRHHAEVGMYESANNESTYWNYSVPYKDEDEGIQLTSQALSSPYTSDVTVKQEGEHSMSAMTAYVQVWYTK